MRSRMKNFAFFKVPKYYPRPTGRTYTQQGVRRKGDLHRVEMRLYASVIEPNIRWAAYRVIHSGRQYTDVIGSAY